MAATSFDDFDAKAMKYQGERIAHWDAVARKSDSWSGAGGYYHRRLIEIYRFLIPPGQRVLEIGCGRGDLLAALGPSLGVGIDFSSEMIQRARERHPGLVFEEADAHNLELEGTFDFIIMSDLLNDLWDIQAALGQVKRLTSPQSRIILNSYSRAWELPLSLAEKLNLARPSLYQNWVTVPDVDNLMTLSGFEVIRAWSEILWPVRTPLIDRLCNRYLVKVWPFYFLALSNFIVARPQPQHRFKGRPPRVSVVIPARNEAGNIPQIFTRTPEMGRGTELVFVEGHSEDKTFEVIQDQITSHPERRAKVFKQNGVGKGDAVRLGMAHADGDMIMILDADLTVAPEDLPRYYDLLHRGLTEVANGVRLIYPMEEAAMRYVNLLGNKAFSSIFSWLLGQWVKDTLCGTKALWKSDYERIAANRAYFGEFDPFGDFDLLFGAAKLNLKIMDLPIRYGRRVYGKTNIQRWKHGWLLLKMVVFATRKIKFV
jgi:ubiquinone/menaquinone biosynthesis C-methylase UbiE